MCGLFGTIGPVPNRRVVLKILSDKNMSRGEDSTGVADISDSGGYIIRKQPINARLFWPNIQYCEKYCIIGHTRNATSGAVSVENAHPWCIGNIIGAHNGGVWNLYSVKKYLSEVHKVYDKDLPFQVDSQYLLYMLDKFGHLGPAMGGLNVTYWDRINNTLNLICWKNPLHVLISFDKKWAVWSSEEAHLQFAMTSCGLIGSMHKMDEEMFEFEKKKNGYLDIEIRKVPFDLKHRDQYSWGSSYGGDYSNRGNQYWNQFPDDGPVKTHRIGTSSFTSSYTQPAFSEADIPRSYPPMSLGNSGPQFVMTASGHMIRYLEGSSVPVYH